MTDLKDEIQEILHPEKKRLHPPPDWNTKEHMETDLANAEKIMEEWKDPLLPIQIVGEKVSECRTLTDSHTADGIKGGEVNTPPKGDDSKPAIDFNSMPEEYWDYCDSSDAKRAWNRAKFGTSHRGSTEQLKKDVKDIKEKMELVRRMPPEVMKELKEVIRNRKKD